MTRWVESKRECSQFGSCQGGGRPRESRDICIKYNSGSGQGGSCPEIMHGVV